MSFVGRIVNLMCVSGLAETLGECYGPNTLLQMLDSKAIARALRGHFLIDGALSVLLMQQLISQVDIDDCQNSEKLTSEEITSLLSCMVVCLINILKMLTQFSLKWKHLSLCPSLIC